MADEAEPTSFLDSWNNDLLAALKQVTVDGYETSASITGNITILTVKGAEGDLTTFKQLKVTITNLMKALAERNQDSPDNLTPLISMRTKGDDMIILCDFDF